MEEERMNGKKITGGGGSLCWILFVIAWVWLESVPFTFLS